VQIIFPIFFSLRELDKVKNSEDRYETTTDAVESGSKKDMLAIQLPALCAAIFISILPE
jgi:hypothetical protein